MDTAVSVELFVEILNRYVYYFDQGNETVRTSLRSASHQKRKAHPFPIGPPTSVLTNLTPETR